jgi:predicted component of type VI protein secretion system
MPLRLVALDEGSDITVDRTMMIVGRHPQCHARLESIRVSRRHCCVSPSEGELLVQDLGSTNGIRINGQRVEEGRLRPGDELSIAHIRFRLEDGTGLDRTLAASMDSRPRAGDAVEGRPGEGRVNGSHLNGGSDHGPGAEPPQAPPAALLSVPPGSTEDNPIAAAIREAIPPHLAGRYKINVVLEKLASEACTPEALELDDAKARACPPASSR